MQAGCRLYFVGKIIFKCGLQRARGVHNVDVVPSLHNPPGLDSVQPLRVLPEPVITDLMPDKQGYQQGCRQANYQATDIE